MEFLSLSSRRSSLRNVPSGEERGKTDVFVGYCLPDFEKRVPILQLQLLVSIGIKLAV